MFLDVLRYRYLSLPPFSTIESRAFLLIFDLCSNLVGSTLDPVGAGSEGSFNH